jgi:lysozyme
VNEHLFTNNDGLRLITQFEGAPRLKARRCEGGAWELSYGVTFYPDGSPVREGDTCTEEQAMAMFRHALQVFEEAVKRLVTVPLTSHQFSALVAFCYNIGESNMASSTVLKEVNAGRFDDAAAAFGMWVFATLDGYKQAFRGLLRRRYAEAACFLGYDWTEACADEAIALQREKPASLPGKDRVIYKTPFKDVLRVAQRYPLSPAIEPAPEAKPAPALIPDTPAAPPQADAKGDGASLATQPVSAPPAPEQKPAASTSSGPSRDVAAPEAPKAAAPAKVPPAIIPVPEKPKEPVVIAPKTIDVKAIPYGEVDPTQATNMSGSRRVAGMVVVGLGSMTQILAAREIVSSSVGAVFYDMSRDPIVVALLIGGVFWVVGWLTRKRGTQIVAKGMAGAQTLLK